ncbi:MAG: anaerobic sulfatase maturase [Puniceicoccales bacterium]
MTAPFHVMTKPAGAACNLACEYCYYLEKSLLYPESGAPRMSDTTLDRYIRDYIDSQKTREVQFAWQGGEPTLLGLGFFEKVIELQQKYKGHKVITNALQTNGTFLNADWASFFKEHSFLIGISIDGPEEIHDHYRVDRGGRPTFAKVMRGWEVLQSAGVDVNSLTVVNRLNSQHPEKVYEFLKSIGSTFLQFIPIVERLPDDRAKDSLDLAGPPEAGDPGARIPVTPWSVRPRDFGKFLNKIFDRWIRNDVGTIFVQHFDGALAKWTGSPGGQCVFAEECGRAMALEHNGDLYSCDHYVYPSYKLGNIREKGFAEMADSPEQIAFGRAKRTELPTACKKCSFRFACNGDCPKHRFVPTGKGQPGISYLCPGLKAFFSHIDAPMREMANLYRSGQPPARIMEKYRD